MEEVLRSPQKIEVFADVWCPFTHVGLRAVADIRSEAGREDIPIVVRSWPLELVNGAPMDPVKTVANITALRSQVVPHLFAAVDNDEFVTSFPTSTIDALELVADAYEVSSSMGERASFMIRDALFEQGRDVGSREVLRTIADELGLDVTIDPSLSKVRRDWEEGQARGVIGSPHFFVGESDMFCPALQLSRDADSRLHVSADIDRLRSLVTTTLLHW